MEKYISDIADNSDNWYIYIIINIYQNSNKRKFYRDPSLNTLDSKNNQFNSPI